MHSNEQFDPYHKWLGIYPQEQPPTMYRLLGLREFESDSTVINNAADRLSAYLRTMQTGRHGEFTGPLLNAVASARICLTHPHKKANYDAVLRAAAPADEAPPSEPQEAMNDDLSSSEVLTLRHYDNLELVRKHRFGDVFKGRHRDSGRMVSIKMLPVASMQDEQVLRRFEREQRVTLSLSHPNLITGFDAGLEHGRHFLVTEYVVGTDLATLVSHQGPLQEDQAIDYVRQAARGLTQLHMHGVFHRNIKPQVLFVDMQGRVKVTNLFLARLSDLAANQGPQEELTRMGQLLGTAEYMAPEQVADAKHVDGRADIYALGCVLYFLLAGRPPYTGASMMEKLAAHRTQPIPLLNRLPSRPSRRLELIYRRMLAKEPQARYPFIGDAVSALEKMQKRNLFQQVREWFALNA